MRGFSSIYGWLWGWWKIHIGQDWGALREVEVWRQKGKGCTNEDDKDGEEGWEVGWWEKVFELAVKQHQWHFVVPIDRPSIQWIYFFNG